MYMMTALLTVLTMVVVLGISLIIVTSLVLVLLIVVTHAFTAQGVKVTF
jgi:hypothetical protein